MLALTPVDNQPAVLFEASIYLKKSREGARKPSDCARNPSGPFLSLVRENTGLSSSYSIIVDTNFIS